MKTWSDNLGLIAVAVLLILAGTAAGCGDDGDEQSAAADTGLAMRGEDGGPCYPNNTCNADLVCAEGVCVPDPVPSGQAGGSCTAEGTCDPGLTCAQGRCVNDASEPGTAGGPCDAGGDCDEGAVCVLGVCVSETVLPGGEGDA